IVQVEPDRAGSLFNMAPRVLMNERDLASTKLILPGSRVTNALLLAGSEESVSDFVENLTLRDSDRLRTPDEARPEVSSAIDRAGHFLNLAVLTAIILSTVAIALAARAYASKNAKPCALLRVLGASRRQVFIYFAKELGILTLVCLLIGVSLGLLAQHSVGLLITGWVQGDLPPAKLLGSARAVFVGLIASLGFALPYLLQLPNIAPASILRASTNGSKPNGRLLILFALIATLLITPWDPQAWRLSAWVALGIVMAMILLAFFGQALLGLMYRARHRLGLASRFGANNLWRRKVLTQLQIAGLALGLSALFTLTLVRDQLLDSWLQQLPESAPNQFLINIQPDEKQALAAFFRAHNLAAPKFYPMTRARLVSINDKPMQLEDYQSPRAKRLANREFNLSYSEKLKPDNKVVGGKYWAENSVDLELSFEKDIAKTLGLALGDVIEFAAAGENLTAKITSIRTVQWETMGVNFFVEGTRTLLEPFPATFITSFHLPENNDHVMAELVRNFPSVTALDVSALIEQVRKIMNRASTAIEFVALFTLLAGGLVLVSAIHTTQQERNLSTALIKTFGGSRFRTMSLHAAEFLIIGIISGVAGATAAQMCTWLIAREVLNIDYAFNWLLIVNGGILAAIAVLCVGLIAIFLSFKKPTRILLNPP
ncbi:MAG: FtsX-like permease family protein, partial [Pseudomonadota bacterium]